MAALLAFALALTVVETYAVMLTCYAVYLILCGRRRAGLALFLLSAGYFAAAQSVILPRFAHGTGGASFLLFQTISTSNPVTQHFLMLVPSTAAIYAGVLFVPLLGLPLLDWRMLAVMVPTVGINFLALLGGYTPTASPRSWHTNPIIPICFLAAIGGLARLAVYPRFTPRAARGVALALLAAGLALAGWLGPLRGSLPLPSRLYRPPARPQPTGLHAGRRRTTNPARRLSLRRPLPWGRLHPADAAAHLPGRLGAVRLCPP